MLNTNHSTQIDWVDCYTIQLNDHAHIQVFAEFRNYKKWQWSVYEYGQLTYCSHGVFQDDGQAFDDAMRKVGGWY